MSERGERATVNQTVWQSLLVCSEAEKHGNKQVRLTPSGRSYCSTRARPCGLTGHQIPVFLFDPITRAWWACLSPCRLQQSDAPNHSFRQVSRGIIYFSRHPRSACRGDGASLTCRRSTETLHCCFRRWQETAIWNDRALEEKKVTSRAYATGDSMKVGLICSPVRCEFGCLLRRFLHRQIMHPVRHILHGTLKQKDTNHD